MGQRSLTSDLHIITQQLSQIIDTPIEESLTRLVALTRHTFAVPVVAISMFDEKRQKFSLLNTCDFFGNKRDLLGFDLYINDDVLIIEDTRKDLRFEKTPLFLDDVEMRFYVSCPIYGKKRQKTGAIILLDSEPRSFCLSDLSNLNEIIKLIEMEINNCRLSKAQKLLLKEVDYKERLGFTDQKTRVWNVAGFRKILAFQLAESIESGVGFGLLAVDIDHLTRINEQYGVEVGDELLKTLSRVLMRTCRSEDTIARGDFSDFIVLVHTDSIVNIKGVVDRIYENLAGLSLDSSHGKIELSATLGYTGFDPEITHPDLLLAHAEIALLKGKRAGRNRVHCHITSERD
ncbi:sensor domain-containing diguanylate cyclase [Legionella spiritensis]|uniref:Sensor histidine kinase n=1 Tax=Legionella spiritensis TaxID=452 RepID=A0A0W0YWH9_LEGSP|nr:sensor domain-containing diguanylate cyclase [Legionella spiritensis]KTD61228.1 sensor histidine kinase [Legionella spiritensis]SNV28077.1 Diguanylate kinase [Legionella spiritensis]